MKLKSNTLCRLLLVCTMILFSSCEKDLYEEPQQQKGLRISEKSFEELMKEPKFNQSFSTVFKSNNNPNAKTAMEDQYGFTIANKPAKVVVTDSLTAYTMLISRENQDPNYFENLVIQTNNHNQTTATLFKYTPTIIEEYPTHNSFTFSGKVAINTLDIPSQGTTVKAIDENVTNSCVDVTLALCHQGGSDHIAGENCTQIFYVHLTFCQDDDDDNNYGSGDYGVPFDSGSTSGGEGDYTGGYAPSDTPEETEDPILTSPVHHSIDIDDGEQDNEPSTPCEELTALTNPAKANIVRHIATLKNQINNPPDDKEHGFETRMKLEYDGTYSYTTSDIPLSYQNSIPLSTGNFNIGGGHLHTKKGHSMFSFGDIKSLLDIYEAAADIRKNQVYLTVTCRNALTGIIETYAIKVDNYDFLRSQVDYILDNPKYSGMSLEQKLFEIHKIQANNYQENLNNLEKSFLQQFGSSGFSLYKANDASLTNWSKLAIEQNPDTTSPNQLILTRKPC